MYNKNLIISKLKNKLNEINNQLLIYIACFTGHRAQKLPWNFNEDDIRCIRMKENLEKIIEKSILRGYFIFLCGMALGFDIICAETVLKLKEKYPYVKLIGALPCKNQYKKWKKEQIDRYKNVLNKLDGIRCIYDEYTPNCMQERNQYMVNNSSLVIALFDNIEGGTKKTIDYARKNGKEIIIIEP